MNNDPITPWAMLSEEVVEFFKSDKKRGLSSEEASVRLKLYGLNVLSVEKKISTIHKILAQFKSPVVLILIFATLVSALLGEFTDSIAILAIVIINGFIGYTQEAKAEAAVEALKKLSAPKGRVIRDGHIVELLAAEVCPGDILILEGGDYVSADARLIESSQLLVDEAILTGESLPVDKLTGALEESVILADRKNMLFASTAITTGSAKAIVTATSMSTEIGRIAKMIESAQVTQTPIQIKLQQVSNKLLIFCGVVVVIVAALGLYHKHNWLDVLFSAISLAVAAIPEGLPTVVTLALALAVRRMTKRNAIVKKLHAVETLGSTNIICTDKTGTLTTGKMRVREIFTLGGGIVDENDVSDNTGDTYQSLIASAVLCSNASLLDDGGSTGDPTEVALLYLAKSHFQDSAQLHLESPRVAEMSFDSILRRMSVVVKKDDGLILHAKGAPESILSLCHLTHEENLKITSAVEKLSSKGRRLLAIARRQLTADSAEILNDRETLEKGLDFLGLVAIADPPRLETIPAIKQCRESGIKVVMITGDHPITARAIAKELGIITEGVFDQVLTGVELEKMSLKDLDQRVEKIAVYARVSPEHKLKIVQAWKDQGAVVAMTGDGVNDAPALKQASIGIAMGKTGTEVAKQASSMILTDDNFATIVSAIEEGRAINGNIRRTIQYLLSGNLAEILIMFGAAIMGWPSPLAPIHLLWINLVTDGLPSLALAAEPVPKDLLTYSKRPSPESFLNRSFYKELILVGGLTAVLSLVIYGYSLKTGDELTAKTYVFSFLVFVELFRSFACRSDYKTFFQMEIKSNLYLLAAVLVPVMFQLTLNHTSYFNDLFKVKTISWQEGVILFSLTLIPVTIIELRKMYKYSKPKK